MTDMNNPFRASLPRTTPMTNISNPCGASSSRTPMIDLTTISSCSFEESELDYLMAEWVRLLESYYFTLDRRNVYENVIMIVVRAFLSQP